MPQDYKRNHYVPVWYQKGFVCPNSNDLKLSYLDLNPPTRFDGRGNIRRVSGLRRLGPKSCFCQDDLYTTFVGGNRSTDVEENFFGEVDRKAQSAVAHFNMFGHSNPGMHTAHNDMLLHLCTQKLRTPKGLAWLKKELGVDNKYALMVQLQIWKTLFAAIWSESVWLVADASNSPTKFILSDHPVTVYNRECRPLAPQCTGCNDPDIRMHGSHTIFPLSADKVLLLTNLSWARNPYQSAVQFRPNPKFERNAMSFLFSIQSERLLSEQEVLELNYIIKRRSYRYIAAGREEWLFPERHVNVGGWSKFGHGYLCMPDPRAMTYSREVLIGYKGGRSDAFDEYGRKPWQSGFKQSPSNEWEAFQRFQGEFAYLFGPKRRGRAFEFGRLSPEEDGEEFHRHHLELHKQSKRKKIAPRD